MKSLIVGYGSIGRRHARLLSAMGHEVAVASAQTDVDFKPFPTREFWLDIGHREDYEQAAGHYQRMIAQTRSR